MKIQKKPDYLIFADSAKKGENAEFPDISRGWGITIEQTASKPPMEWMNGAFNRIDKNILYLLQQGVPEWSEEVTYPVNAIIKCNGVLYTAIEENNNAIPTTNTNKWKKSQAEILIASTTQKGIVQLSSSTDSDSETQAATPLAVKKVNGLLQSISAKFHCYEKETQIYSGDKKQYIFVRDDGVSGFVDKDGLIKWGFDSEGHLAIGAVPLNRIEDLTFNSSINSDSETQAATPLAVKKVNDLLQSISVKYHCYDRETRMYSGDRKQYIFTRDDGCCGFVGADGQIKWAFEQGSLGIGTVPVNHVAGLDQFVRERSIPVGVPMPWPQVTPPPGYFECNGAPIDKNRFPKLAAAYPSGFLPDLRGEFIRGWDNARGADPYRVMLSWQNHQLAAHRHVGGWGESLTSLNAENRQRTAPFGCTGETGNWVGATGNDNDNPLFYTNDGTNGSRTNQKGTTSWFDLNPNGLVGNETRPRNVAFMYIVKAE